MEPNEPLGRTAAALLARAGRGIAAAVLSVTLVAGLTLGLSPVHPARAEQGVPASRPSVLLIDSSLGDFDAFSLHWLGEDVTEVANEGGLSLLTSENPAWWGASPVEGAGDEVGTPEVESVTGAAAEPVPAAGAASGASAPATFLLGSSAQQPVAAADIVWALDEIAASGANPKTFIVASGASGLQARLYVEDLADARQSARADIVGIAFLGTAHQGYSAATAYPKLPLWGELAAASGLEADDVVPGSAFLNDLNSAPFPNIVKALQINGQIGDMGFGFTDGAALQSDMALPGEVSTQVQSALSRATVSQRLGLSALWLPYSQTLDNEFVPVDANVAERLSAMDCYVTSAEVKMQVKEFYEAWFADGAPVTHISSVLTLDLSGSMREVLEGGTTRLDAAKAAAQDYMQAVDVRGKTSYAVPTDVTVLGFNTSVSTLATGSDAGARAALDGIDATDETDIGQALRASLDALGSASVSTERRILFLSDGASTQGESNVEIMAGAVGDAKASGVVIDTVAFGTMGESDVDFLKEVAASTGGDFYESTDTYGLKVSFLKAYYTSLGLNLLDSEVAPSAGAALALGDLDGGTRSLEVGVLADGETPGLALLRDGEEMGEDSYSVQTDSDGLLTLQLEHPAPGAYSLVLNGSADRAHVFVVGQLDLFRTVDTSVEATDISLPLLVGVGIALVVGLAALVVFGRRPPKEPAPLLADTGTEGLSAVGGGEARDFPPFSQGGLEAQGELEAHDEETAVE
ncbi:MAG: VWA domain-containing protein [Coriobacteriales bacterium]|jgi:hypothetical protein|nr:VWA domain-containing protein [Coriobacteriales bacterium]